MSALTNPLAHPSQLGPRASALPPDLQDLIFHASATLAFAAGLLLQLPLSVTARACVVLARYRLSLAQADDGSNISSNNNEEEDEPALSSMAVVWLVAKMSSHPVSIESVGNVHRYLKSREGSPFFRRLGTEEDSADLELRVARLCHPTETDEAVFVNSITSYEAKILRAVGFDTHVALPHPLAVTYLQALDFLGLPAETTQANAGPQKKGGVEGNAEQASKLAEGKQPNNSPKPPPTRQALARRTISYLNTALLSPQLLYLTHSPSALAAAAIYAAARDLSAKMPECEWWEVFDVEREELGFLVVGMRSLEGWVEKARRDGGDGGEGIPGYGTRGMIENADVRACLRRRGLFPVKSTETEEDAMMRKMDEQAGELGIV